MALHGPGLGDAEITQNRIAALGEEDVPIKVQLRPKPAKRMPDVYVYIYIDIYIYMYRLYRHIHMYCI